MRSLQFKFTLALLLTSLTAVLLVGVVARHQVLSKFNRNAMELAFRNHQNSLQAYISAHGSWEKAQRAQPWREWMRQEQQAQNPPPPPKPGERSARMREAIPGRPGERGSGSEGSSFRFIRFGSNTPQLAADCLGASPNLSYGPLYPQKS